MTVDPNTSFWDRAAEPYAKSPVRDPVAYQRTLDETRGLLEPSHSVLELGCGTGTTALHLADAVRSYLATDLSPEMIRIAESKHAAREGGPLPNLSFRAATAQSLASPSDSGTEDKLPRFDAVLSFNTIHLVQDLPGTLRHVHELLRDGGLFVTKTPCVADMNLAIRLVLPVMRAVGKAPNVISLKETDLDGLIRAAGFDILRSENHGSKGKDSRPFIVARKI